MSYLCSCPGICYRFNLDGPELYQSLKALRVISPELDEMARRDMLSTGCDLCERQDAISVMDVPEIVKSFLKVNRLCVFCRNTMWSTAKVWKWEICWKGTTDREIKWFLAAFVLTIFRHRL